MPSVANSDNEKNWTKTKLVKKYDKTTMIMEELKSLMWRFGKGLAPTVVGGRKKNEYFFLIVSQELKQKMEMNYLIG